MKTRMVEERIGEHLGPVDWSYDFTQHAWATDRGGINPDTIAPAVERLRQLEQPGRWLANFAHSSAEWEVLRVGMYDGWPFWKPTPAILTTGPLGPEWHFFYDLNNVRTAPDGNR